MGNTDSSNPYTPPVHIESKGEASDRKNMRQIQVSDLIHGCNLAQHTMGFNNPNRALLFNCAFALRQLVDRLAETERKLAEAEKKLTDKPNIQLVRAIPAGLAAPVNK